jgi:hypothetical protein
LWRRITHDDDRTEGGTSPKCLTWVGPCYPSSASSTDDLRLGLHEGRSSTELRWSPTITHADTMRHTRGGKLRWAGRAGAMNCAPTRLTPRHIHPHTADTMRRRALWGYYPCRRHEFVGNPGESEVRAHLRGCALLHSACQRYALVAMCLHENFLRKLLSWVRVTPQSLLASALWGYPKEYALRAILITADGEHTTTIVLRTAHLRSA